MMHELKTWPEYFEAVWTGIKCYEIRKNDRNFSLNDELYLREFVPCEKCNGSGLLVDYSERDFCDCDAPHGRYTGRLFFGRVTHILRGGQFGIEEGYVVMSFKFMSKSSIL
jgi:hypothetical protein